MAYLDILQARVASVQANPNQVQAVILNDDQNAEGRFKLWAALTYDGNTYAATINAYQDAVETVEFKDAAEMVEELDFQGHQSKKGN